MIVVTSPEMASPGRVRQVATVSTKWPTSRGVNVRTSRSGCHSVAPSSGIVIVDSSFHTEPAPPVVVLIRSECPCDGIHSGFFVIMTLG